MGCVDAYSHTHRKVKVGSLSQTSTSFFVTTWGDPFAASARKIKVKSLSSKLIRLVTPRTKLLNSDVPISSPLAYVLQCWSIVILLLLKNFRALSSLRLVCNPIANVQNPTKRVMALAMAPRVWRTEDEASENKELHKAAPPKISAMPLPDERVS